MIRRLSITLVLGLAVSAASCSRGPQPDIVVHNAKIITVDPEFRIAEAMAVKGDRILAVGSSRDILGTAGHHTSIIDLGGKTVLPGLIDSHLHACAAAMYEFDHTVPDMETIEDVLAYAKARADALEDGEWIAVSQVFITRLRDKRYPTREELDRAAPKNPVVFRTGPDASLNSLALKLSGIDRNFRITDGEPGRVELDPKTGEPTGILRSCSRFIKYKSSEKIPTPEDRIDRLRQLLADYNSVGITGIVEGDAEDDEVELYRKLKERGQLTCRTFLALHIDAQQPLEKIEERIRQAAAHPLHQYDNMLWLRGIKAYLDGGMLTGSAYMRRPWGVSKVYSITDPKYQGMLFIDAERLYRIAKASLENDLQFTAHSVGDGAVHAMLDAYERIDKELSVRERRPNITHSNFMSREAIEKMKTLGIVANMQPAWLYLDGATLLGHFGEERLAWFQPYKTIFEQGVIVGGGSDHMQKIGSFRSINAYNPFLGMETAITRQPRWMDGPLHPEQCISREQAIRFYTINNAYLTFEEKEKGSLESGKLADFIVIDKDILTCPPNEIRSIQVERTYLGGKEIYTRPGI
ncbi:MAG: amidohydrolase [Acidobacteria bacterium]|nr:amidohydrolase [Acidobacteriota bacterium]